MDTESPAIAISGSGDPIRRQFPGSGWVFVINIGPKPDLTLSDRGSQFSVSQFRLRSERMIRFTCDVITADWIPEVKGDEKQIAYHMTKRRSRPVDPGVIGAPFGVGVRVPFLFCHPIFRFSPLVVFPFFAKRKSTLGKKVSNASQRLCWLARLFASLFICLFGCQINAKLLLPNKRSGQWPQWSLVVGEPDRSAGAHRRSHCAFH